MPQLVFRQVGQALDLAHGVVGEVADGAGGERGQARQARRLVAAERVAQHRKDVSFDAWSVLRPSVIAIWRPRATMRLNGVRPMKV